MDVEEWRKRYQEILTAVENASIKTREETEKSDKAFSALEKELLTQLQESKNKISILEERLSLCRDQNDQLLKQQEASSVIHHSSLEVSETHNSVLNLYRGLSGVCIEHVGVNEFHGVVDVGILSGLRFSLKEDDQFLEYYYQPLHIPPTVTDDFSNPFCFPSDMIVKFLQKLHSATLS